MSDSRSTVDPSIRKFWDRYIRKLQEKGIQVPFLRWYVIRAEHCLKAFPDRELVTHGPDDVKAYFTEIGRKQGLKDWQFFQIVDAIQNLFELIEVEWLGRADWSFWKSSARSLSSGHPTIAREVPIPEIEQQTSDACRPDMSSVRSAHQKVLVRLVTETRRRGYSIRTEQAYEGWVARFIAFSGNREPKKIGVKEVIFYLEYLAVHCNAIVSTQNQALNALVFFYRQVLRQSLGDLGVFDRPKRPRKLPVVLTRQEVSRLLSRMDGIHYLMTAFMYGTGMRLMECVRLRVQEEDFNYRQFVISNAKGHKDRVVPFPGKLITPVSVHLEKVRVLHKADLEKGLGEVFLPDALARKYPKAPREWGWQYLFPCGRLSADPRSGQIRRHHIHENGIQKVVKKAAREAGLVKRVNCHCLRNAWT